MARFKKFGTGMKLSDLEPLKFELEGQEFNCYPAIQGSVLLEFVRDSDSDSGGETAKALYNFLNKVMNQEEYDRLNTLLHDPEVIIDVALIGEVVAWLVEQYSERPTKRSEVSSNGQEMSGTTPMEELSSPVSV